MTKIKIPNEYREVAISNGVIFDKEKNEYYVPKDIFISVFNKFIPLTIELIPASNWKNNVRSECKNDWDWIRRKSYQKANYRCEICNGVGDRHPVECHEIWDFDVDTRTQKLIGLISLCPLCHKAKHIGLAFINEEEELVIEHIKKVNNWNDNDVNKYINEAFLIFEVLSEIEWKLDLSFLEDF